MSHQESTCRSPTVGSWQPRGCEGQSQQNRAAPLCEPNPLLVSSLEAVAPSGLPLLCQCTSICSVLGHSCKQRPKDNHHDFYQKSKNHVLAAKLNCCKVYVVLSHNKCTLENQRLQCSVTSEMLCNVIHRCQVHVFHFKLCSKHISP